jgi:hypothetical protein
MKYKFVINYVYMLIHVIYYFYVDQISSLQHIK